MGVAQTSTHAHPCCQQTNKHLNKIYSLSILTVSLSPSFSNTLFPPTCPVIATRKVATSCMAFMQSLLLLMLCCACSLQGSTFSFCAYSAWTGQLPHSDRFGSVRFDSIRSLSTYCRIESNRIELLKVLELDRSGTPACPTARLLLSRVLTAYE